MPDAPRQVVVTEDDALLTVTEIKACLMQALDQAINREENLEDHRKRWLRIKRCLKIEERA